MHAEQTEIFNEADRPAFELSDTRNFKIQKPWNYDKVQNADRKYPLVVSLHGGTDRTDAYYAPCIVGNDEEMQAYPCFFMAPNSPQGWGEAASWVREEIEGLIHRFRIDGNRIYLMGFSMGGSGSYPFANACYDDHGRLFAGIMRVAGQSQPEVRDAIAEKTSIWYHIGLEDSEPRIEMAEQAYQFIKDFKANSNAVENQVTDSVGPCARITRTLVRDKVEMMKISTYAGLGHDSSVPFQDPKVLEWLFSQSLKDR